MSDRPDASVPTPTPIAPVSGLAALLSDEELSREVSRRHLAKMNAGYRAKKATGGYLGGMTPYGWESNGEGGLKPFAPEQHAIGVGLTMREWGASYRTISEFWIASGMRLRRGTKPFSNQTVKDVLERARRYGLPKPERLTAIAKLLMGMPVEADDP